jgi:hypothetical protein
MNLADLLLSGNVEDRRDQPPAFDWLQSFLNPGGPAGIAYSPAQIIQNYWAANGMSPYTRDIGTPASLSQMQAPIFSMQPQRSVLPDPLASLYPWLNRRWNPS